MKLYLQSYQYLTVFPTYVQSCPVQSLSFFTCAAFKTVFSVLLILRSLLAQFKQEEDTLINRNVDNWGYKGTHFTIPDEGVEGYIEEKGTSKVLGIVADSMNVELQTKIEENENQMWKRSAGDANGWFSFTNEKSGKVLATEKTGANPTISGEADYLPQWARNGCEFFEE